MKSEIIMDMIGGYIDPYVVAEKKVKEGKVSPSSIRSVDQDLISFISTGVLPPSPHLDFAFITSDGSNLGKIAERIARYNYYAASLNSTDLELISTVAFTLFQVIFPYTNQFDESLDLFTEYYPVIVSRNINRETKFRVNYLGMKLYSLTKDRRTENRYEQVLHFGFKALEYENPTSSNDTWELGEIYFTLGVAFMETWPKNEGKLRKSVDLLNKALFNKQFGKEKYKGMVLNSLGYCNILIGKLKRDENHVNKAIDILKEALIYRENEREKRLTENNLKIANNFLSEKLTSNEGNSPQINILNRIDASTQLFSKAMSPNLSQGKKNTLLQDGINNLLDISVDPLTTKDHYLKARSELAIGIGLSFNGDFPEAICFLRASLRKFDNLDISDKLPRITAAYYNLGLAFANMEGLRSKVFYVSEAIKNFELAKNNFSLLEADERVKVCETLISNLKPRTEK